MGSNKEINFKKTGLNGVIAKLEEYHKELTEIQKTLQQTDEAVTNSLVESTQQFYQERSQKTIQSVGDSLTALQALINQAKQSMDSAFRTDSEAGNKMVI